MHCDNSIKIFCPNINLYFYRHKNIERCLELYLPKSEDRLL